MAAWLVQVGAFDIDVGQDAVEHAWEPPGSVAEQGEHGRDEGHADDESVDQHTDTKTEGDGLEGGVRGLTKLAKTENMISAAAVTMREAWRPPRMTARAGSSVWR